MFPKTFQKLIDQFSALPSVGPKMAERLVLYLFKQNTDTTKQFARDLHEFATNVHYCSRCYNISEEEGECSICRDKKRDKKTICVVEEPLDIIAFEKTRRFLGLYHVLGGNLSVMSAEEIKKLKINQLVQRVKDEEIEEVIVATNPTTDGETTSLYLGRILRPLNAKVTRIARGLPTGGDIEYADEMTLLGALDGRREI
ncbi:recombination protein RecR [bacterium]|nr:recombination protein RecR [bacterium]MBT6754044.1 recombination protein RecR [bacterium]MBT7038074.1 recombination protein RecR [bacterium]MBT7431686.1 recombination protein RecR [bacterium]MBT7992684.1 recombination protein RecR [bacterium]